MNNHPLFPYYILIYMRCNLGPPRILLPGLSGTPCFLQRIVDFLWLGGYSEFEEWKIKIPKYQLLPGILLL